MIEMNFPHIEIIGNYAFFCAHQYDTIFFGIAHTTPTHIVIGFGAFGETST